MMLITRCLGLMLLCTAVGGCSQSLYSQWGNQLNDLTRHQRRPEDVSMLLGTPPSRCESLNNPAPVCWLRARQIGRNNDASATASRTTATGR